jgi:hypothetical protein
LLPNLCRSRGKGYGRMQGYGAATIWKQRADRWFLNWPRRLLTELWLLLTYGAGLSVWGNIQYRIYTIWWLAINFVGFLWVPYLVWFLSTNTGGWRFILYLKASLFATSVVSATLRIMCMPPKLRSGLHPLAPFCFPVLSLANMVMRAWAFVSTMYWFIPFIRAGNIRTVPNYDLGDESVKMIDHSTSNGVLDLSSSSTLVKRSLVSSPPGSDKYRDKEEQSNNNNNSYYYNSDWEEDDDDGSCWAPVYA